MTDLNAPPSNSVEMVALIELLFFAYRDFVSDPDAVLEELKFGRAHHRVIHFVGRNPGMTVAQLLDILKITKQSLSRALKELLARQLVYQIEGPQDRRQRLLYLTPAGAQLHQRLMAPQLERLERTVNSVGVARPDVIHQILLGLISPENRDTALQWISRASLLCPEGKGGEAHG